MKLAITAPYQMAPIEEGAYASDFAKLAEDLGFESLWVVEHAVMCVETKSVYPYAPSGRSPFGADVNQPDPLIWLTWAAAATKRIRLATGILILPQRNPVVLAKALASLDRLSGGRLMLGMGVGWVREEAEAVGVCFENRGRRANEAIDVMRTLWREPVASFDGEFTHFDRVVSAPKPVQAGGVPIIVGGHSKAAARRAGRQGDGFYPLGVDLDGMQELRAVMQEAAREAGRDPAAIEITMGGAANPELVAAYEAAGVHRMLLFPSSGDLGKIRVDLEAFCREVASTS
ncbi:MAG: LLM class F420-dependent oxidoreductase [Myxococcota bacterium]